jgi:hypothetical protein
MAANKVIYGTRTIIDLTNDTVTAETLLTGHTAHKSDGTIITGIMFDGLPDEYSFFDAILDSNGDPIKDNSGNVIEGKTVYKKV